MACAWHRQVRRANARRSQAHAKKKTNRTIRKTKPKARRRGAVPANPLGDRLPLFRHAILSFYWVCRSVHLLNFASFGRLKLA